MALVEAESFLGRGLQDRGRGSNKGPITVARGTSERQKKPSVTRSFNRLLLASVTAEVAGSSPVVPAIDSKALSGSIGTKSATEIGCNLGELLHPICTQNRPLRKRSLAKITNQGCSEDKTRDITAACAFCLADVIACV